MITVSKGTWILIADGEKALFLENQGTAVSPQLAVICKKNQDNPPDREQASDRPGRMNDGPSAQRSALEETNWHELGKVRFAARLAELLYAEAQQNRFENLILVAEPQVLGDVRAHLHAQVRARVSREIPKVLTNHPIDEITRLVAAELERAA